MRGSTAQYYLATTMLVASNLRKVSNFLRGANSPPETGRPGKRRRTTLRDYHPNDDNSPRTVAA
jgi:hypothetical protein